MTADAGASSGLRRRVTRTGGRPAITGVIRGRYSLSVGDPGEPVCPGWKWTPLTSVARLESGHTPSRRHPEYWDGEIPWIGIRDATKNHGRTLSDTEQHTNELGIANSSARLLPANTVCLSRTASVGYVVVMGVPMATSQDFVNWVCTERLDNRFLKYVLLADRDSMLSFAHGTTHQTIYFPEVKAFHVCLPPLQVQRAIGDVLTAIDDLIENNRRRVEVLEEMARAIYREWFVHFRFPGHEDATFVDSPLGPIPDGWSVKTLGEIAMNQDRLRRPLSRAQRQERPGPIPYYGAAKLIDWIDDWIFDGEYLLFAEDGSVQTSDGFPVLRLVHEKFWANNHTHILQGSGVSTRFLYLSASRQPIIAYITGAAQPKITQANLNRIPFVVGSDEIQHSFSAAVDPMFDERRDLERSTAPLAALRDLLLPKLVTGEIDVSTLDLDELVDGPKTNAEILHGLPSVDVDPESIVTALHKGRAARGAR